MAIGAKEYIETVTYLSKMYDFFNEKLFGGALIKPVITISPDEKNKAYGWITRDKLWKESENDEGMYEINLSAQFLNRPISEIASTLIHEMCHQFARVNDFKDTARSGSFHNKLFMASVLLIYLEELSEVGSSGDPFLYGEKTAYTECLEWVQIWDEAEKNGLDFHVETRYPL